MAIPSLLRFLLKIVLGLLVLAAGVMTAVYFLKSTPPVKRVQPQIQPTLVRVFQVRPTSARVSLRAMGTVVPAREIVLKAQVSGKVLAMSKAFLPGGRVDEQTELLRIDHREYSIAVRKKESALAMARADLELEKGRQEVALQEYRLLKEGSAAAGLEKSELALRKPQLEQVEAEVKQALADVDKARLDWARTRIKAPFPALIRKRNVDIGSLVSPQEPLATLVDTRNYWVETQISLDELHFLSLEANGTADPAVVHSQSGRGTWQGSVQQLTGEVDETTRMATVIVVVPEPLDRRPELLLGDYVQVIIQGRTLDQVYDVPRSALHQKDAVWLYDQGQLAVVKVHPVWKDQNSVYVDQGLQPGDLVITSPLSMPVPGMELKIVQENASAAEDSRDKAREAFRSSIRPVPASQTRAKGVQE